MICRVDGCTRTTRRWQRICDACRHRIRRYGDPHAPRPKLIRAVPTTATFESLVLVETDECVIWPHAMNSYGYARIRHDGRQRPVARLMLERRVGPPPSESHQAAHGPCHNRACVNYRHLRWATCAENSADKLRDDTHNRGERQYNHKLTADDVREIRRRYQPRTPGSSSAALGRLYGVSDVTIRDCVHGRTWGWLS